MDTGNLQILKSRFNLWKQTETTFDGYELSLRVSYLDSPPRNSTSSVLCFRNSRCGMFKTSCMIERNLTQFRNSFWLIRLPVSKLSALVSGSGAENLWKSLTCTVDGDFDVGTRKYQGCNKEAHGDGFSETTRRRNPGMGLKPHGQMMMDHHASQRKLVSYKISWLMLDQLFISRSLGYDFSKNPTASVLNSTRTTEFKKDSCTRSMSNLDLLYEF